MSMKQFTKEQQQKLRQNPYVYNITATRLSLTREFRELFMESYRAGGAPRKILEENLSTNLDKINISYLQTY